MERRWMILLDSYEGLSKKAVNMMSAVVSEYVKYVVPVKTATAASADEISANNLIVIGKAESNPLLEQCRKKGLIDVPGQEQGYCVYVGESLWNPEGQMILVAGTDEPGVLYGCVDFCNRYCGDIICRDGAIWKEDFFELLFGKKLNEWRISSSPAIKTRGIWTWGHVIYDYRRFLENMVRLRLNEVVIWNDRVPFNANDIVEYAHSLGIKVIWGFSWGWGTSCKKILEKFDDRVFQELKENVLQTYEKEYADTGCDGIYFQSFTELSTDYVNGKCIAEVVTELVNDISGELLERHPDLHIQFGLHATSVKNHLDIMKKVDDRVHIVWEDCGAFPYSTVADAIDGFDQTKDLTGELIKLRGSQEQFGVVLKGLVMLDWSSFENFSESYVMGERTEAFLQRRQISKDRVWKIVQGNWLKNADYARRIIELIAQEGIDPMVHALVEDGMLENKIMLPVAIYAQMLWEPGADTWELMGQVAKYPCVSNV